MTIYWTYNRQKGIMQMAFVGLSTGYAAIAFSSDGLVNTKKN